MAHRVTHAELLSWLRYDPETGVFTRLKYTRGRTKVGDRLGSRSARGYLVITFGGKKYYAHRLAVLYMTGEWPKDHVDHRRGATDDNRWTMIRPATPSQNSANCKLSIRNKTGVKGVAFDKQTGKYKATVRRTHLGYFCTIEEAAKAYKAEADKVFREFVRHELR